MSEHHIREKARKMLSEGGHAKSWPSKGPFKCPFEGMKKAFKQFSSRCCQGLSKGFKNLLNGLQKALQRSFKQCFKGALERLSKGL